MTTDRTAAPSRSTALADRPASVAGRTPAPPTDMFSALLGAATPKKGDQPVRRDDNPATVATTTTGASTSSAAATTRTARATAQAGHTKTDDAPPAADAPAAADDATRTRAPSRSRR